MTRCSKEWLDKKHIKLYDYSEFSGLKEVGRGGYGIVCKTVCKTAVKRLDSTVAIKRLIVEKNDEKTIQKFVKE
ncbi:14698_t:CDS:1, partial [Racocetra persica]